MNSPADGTTKAAQRGDLDGSGAEKGGVGCGTGLARLGQGPPEGLSVSQRQVLTIPPGLSPASLFNSPGFFSSRQVGDEF